MLAVILPVFLVGGAGILVSHLGRYTTHSFRITLCTRLRRAECPVDKIKQILRWRSDDSVMLYGRLPDDELAMWLRKSRQVTVETAIASHLPGVLLSPDERDLQYDVNFDTDAIEIN